MQNDHSKRNSTLTKTFSLVFNPKSPHSFLTTRNGQNKRAVGDPKTMPSKLTKLFREKHIDARKIDRESTKEAQKHFPHRPTSSCTSFAAVFKGKCSKHILGEAPTGKRGPPSELFPALLSAHLPLLLMTLLLFSGRQQMLQAQGIVFFHPGKRACVGNTCRLRVLQ